MVQISESDSKDFYDLDGKGREGERGKKAGRVVLRISRIVSSSVVKS